ncbi:hypothetical protein [Kordia jejudonensis]|uniref:hypothetical protein n=1 Tax=Kordia jejudonensis TaxID=1348245 RepID=UPI0012E059E4|nr:hypothetical protein [Kordia jejudonensis]
MKKKNLKSLKLNKHAISRFNHTKLSGGKVIRPTKDISCYPEDCHTVQSINDYTCDLSFMYGSCDLSCNPLFIC